MKDIMLKLDALGYISVAESLGRPRLGPISSTTFAQCVLTATEFGEITNKGQLRRSRSFKVTDFGTNGKPIYDVLVVINTNLPPALRCFRDIAFNRSKIVIFGYP